MRLVQGVRNLRGVAQQLLERQRAFLQALGERLAFQVLQHEVVPALVCADVVEDADVSVLQIGDGAGFAVEALAGFLVSGEVRSEHLERNQAVQARVAAFIHFPHAARSNEREDFVRPQMRTRLQGHA